MNILSERFNTTPFVGFDLDYLLQAADIWNNDNELNFRELEITFSSDLQFDKNELISFLDEFSFSNEFIFCLASLREESSGSIFPESFLNYLQRLNFSIEIDLISTNHVIKPFVYELKLKGKEIDLYILRFLLENFGSEN